MIVFEETMVLNVNNKILNGSFEYKYMEKFNKITISNTYNISKRKLDYSSFFFFKFLLTVSGTRILHSVALSYGAPLANKVYDSY